MKLQLKFFRGLGTPRGLFSMILHHGPRGKGAATELPAIETVKPGWEGGPLAARPQKKGVPPIGSTPDRYRIGQVTPSSGLD